MQAETPSTAAKVRRAYGRGFHDAVRQLGDQTMTANLNTMASKVLECVPADQPANVGTIIATMKEKGLTGNPDHRVVRGCLTALVSAGLIREASNETFYRIVALRGATIVRRKVDNEPTKAPEAATEAPPAAEKPDTLALLAKAASDARALALQLQQLASSIEDIAITVEERIQDVQRKSGKLAQLQQMLRELATEEAAS